LNDLLREQARRIAAKKLDEAGLRQAVAPTLHPLPAIHALPASLLDFLQHHG
jgi:hypothetical protein